MKFRWEFYIVKKVFDSIIETDKKIKLEKCIFFNIAKLQIWYLTSACCNTFLNVFYWQAYISGTSNECKNNNGRRYKKYFKVVFQFIGNWYFSIYWIFEDVKDWNLNFNFNLSLIYIFHFVI